MKINKFEVKNIIIDEIKKLILENKLTYVDESALPYLVKVKSVSIKEASAFFYAMDKINNIFKDNELSTILESAVDRIEKLIQQEKFGEEK